MTHENSAIVRISFHHAEYLTLILFATCTVADYLPGQVMLVSS